MRKVFSTKGHQFFVDDEDFPLVNAYKWHVLTGKDGHLYANSLKVGLMHRFLTSAPKGKVVDHINGNGLDNRRENLRVCTGTQNQANRKISKNNTSGFKGVSKAGVRSKKWRASIRINGKSRHLGHFNTPEEASTRYRLEALKIFGVFAKF